MESTSSVILESDQKSEKSKGKGLSTGAIIAIVCGILLLCCVCVSVIVVITQGNNLLGGLNINPTAMPTTTSIVNPTDGTDPTTNPTNKPATSNKIGDVVTLDDLQLTVIAFENNVISTNQFMQPQDGNKFIAVEVKITNLGTKIENANPFDFQLKDSDDYSYDYSFWNVKKPEFKMTDLKLNDSVRGWLTFEVPTTSNNFKLIYEPSWFATNNIVVELY